MTENALVKLEQAEKWLSEAKSLDDLKDIHDIALAAEAYARAHRLGLAAENHAMEVKLLSARRIGELVPATPPVERNPNGRKGNMSEEAAVFPIERHQLSEFRKLAEIPITEFRERMEDAKAHEEKITYTTMLRKQPHVSHNSGDNEWYTPSPIVEAARKVMGSIDLDPASSDIANRTVRAAAYFTAEDDGLVQPWNGNVWINPPYAQPLISMFSAMVVSKHGQNQFIQACVLVNNATETEWFQRILVISSAVCLLKGRVRFIDMEGIANGAPLQGQAILYIGDNKDAFVREFSEMGVVLGRL